MKYTFRLIQAHEKIPHLTGWYWYINTMDMLLHLFEKTSTGFIAKSVMEVMDKAARSKKAEETDKYIPLGHFRNRTSYLLEMQLMNEFEKGERKSISPMELSGIANDLFQNPKLQAYNEYGAIYVGPNLIGFCMDTGQRVVEETTSDDFVFPIKDEKITIGMWPGGKHYYLKSTAQREFEDKFNTYEDAFSHARMYADEADINFKKDFMYMRQGD